MKILVVGRGWTGKKVFNELISRDHVVTLCDHKNAIEEATYQNYDWVVNCAGMTGTPNVDACELEKEKTLEANAVFPILLQKACEENVFSPRFAHFSSGCIYQGTITDVNADPNYFGSIYSVSKGVSDVYLKNKALVFRIRMPFTDKNERKNYLFKVLNYAKNAKLVDYGQNSLTDLDEAVRVACNLIENDETGPFNLVNSGSVNMHELVELMGIKTEWFTDEEFRQVTVAARSTCTIPAYEEMSDIRSTLTRCIANMKAKNG